MLVLHLKDGLLSLKLFSCSAAQHLRQVGVVGKFVEFFGPGVAQLSIADRATIANMCPEYGATAAFFPVDDVSVKYLVQTGKCRPVRAEGPGSGVMELGGSERCLLPLSLGVHRVTFIGFFFFFFLYGIKMVVGISEAMT